LSGDARGVFVRRLMIRTGPGALICCGPPAGGYVSDF
jgi:hypothetical protein